MNKYTHWQESRETGADWLFTIHDKSQCILLLIQAKMYDANKGVLVGTDKKCGRQNLLQITRLMQCAKKLQAIPFYCAYTHRIGEANGRSAEYSKAHPPAWQPPGGSPPSGQWGCTLIAADHIKRMRKRKNNRKIIDDDIVNYGFPWHLVFCSGHTTVCGFLRELLQLSAGVDQMDNNIWSQTYLGMLKPIVDVGWLNLAADYPGVLGEVRVDLAVDLDE